MHPTASASRTALAVSFALLYVEHSRDLERYLQRALRSPQDAQDVAQETWGRAWQSWRRGELQQHPLPRAWLFRTAHNCAISLLRHRSTVSAATCALDDVTTARLPAPGSAFDVGVCERDIFSRVFAELSTDELRAFTLALRGYSATDTPYLNRVRVSRARAHLRLAYARETSGTSDSSDMPAGSPHNSSSLAPGHLRQLQREYGICSEPDCDQPIAGWCDTCDQRGPFKAPKWCASHLDAHLRQHSGHVAYYPYATHREGGQPA